MANIVINKTAFLDAPITVDSLHGMTFTNESGAHQFVISAMQGGNPLALTGSVSARFMRANNTTILLTGSVTGGKAVITLHQDCYNVPGRFQLAIFNTASGATTCIYAAIGTVQRTVAGELIDSGEAVPDISELLAQIDACEQATAAANAAATKAIRYDTAQTLTDTQKAQARDNISAASDADVDDVNSTLDSILDVSSVPVAGTLNANVAVNSQKITSGSYYRCAYALVDGYKSVKVTKNTGATFRLGFTKVTPANNVDVYGGVVDDTATEISSVIPDDCIYVVVCYCNTNRDAATPEDLLASIRIVVSAGAVDSKARNDIATLRYDMESLDDDISAQMKTINHLTAHVSQTGYDLKYDAITHETGKYGNGTVGTVFSTLNSGTYSYIIIPVENKIYNYPAGARFTHALDRNNIILSVNSTANHTQFDNTSIGAKYLAISFTTTKYDNFSIYENGGEPNESYRVTGEWEFDNLLNTNTFNPDHVYLPTDVYCAVGRTIELYNNLVFLDADKYRVHWTCSKGVEYKRKFSVTGATADIGDYTLRFRVYDENMNVLFDKSATLHIVDNTITGNYNIVPIGDSLTNGKAWIREVTDNLSNGKIVYVGTRKSGSSTNIRHHEGRSGAAAGWYTADSTYTYSDGTTYDGAAGISGTSNPFWDGSKFSLNHYITTQGSTIGVPNAVQILLGTNRIDELENNIAQIKTMIDTIRSEYPSMHIYLCNLIYHSNQDGYHSNGGQGYVSTGGEWERSLDIKVMRMMLAEQEVFDTANYRNYVHIVPLGVCMDRDNDFGQMEVPVNPRLTSVTEKIANEYTHPQEAGYMQMADVMYSVYCATLD